MNIGFDAKRAYQNDTGLGNYSRSLIASLAKFFPENKYFLFAPKITPKFNTSAFSNMHTVTPVSFLSKKIAAAWRRKWMLKDIVDNKMGIFHGLSFELPLGIEKSGIKSVVTVHDLIFERYPHQYKKLDVAIYRNKTKHACAIADKIIAVSRQTKNDLIDFYQVEEQKIEVCYQTCNPFFKKEIPADKLKEVRNRYNLPEKYFLNVGSIIERKDLLTICKAINLLKGNCEIPLVVIGKGSSYKQEVLQYINQHQLNEKIIFLSDGDAAKNSIGFQTAEDFPAIYKMASAFIYPSVFEGFGIPILEAMATGVPVITTNVSCMPETAGNAALYINPKDENRLAGHLLDIVSDNNLSEQLIEKGYIQAEKFSEKNCAIAVMDVYKQLME